MLRPCPIGAGTGPGRASGLRFVPNPWDTRLMSSPASARPGAAGTGQNGATPVPAGAVAPAGPPAQRGWAVPLLVLIAGMFMSVLDISIVNVAIPTIQNDFGVTTEQVQWIATAYSLALGV